MNRYLTTTLPYVNADPHIGHALEYVQADALARFYRLAGDDVFFNTGVDEHGQKILEKAREEGLEPQHYVDALAPRFDRLKHILNLSYNSFIRTTSPAHQSAAQEFWRRCADAGDISKKEYQVKYCVGCELEKTDSELENGRCPLHPNLELELREEENYFFRFSKYGGKLLALYDTHPDFVVPAYRLNEIRSLIERKGLQDFSISRVAEKMPWGVPVPGDESQVMYVWFDALVNYISAIGWPTDTAQFEKWWPVIQFAGKDQVRQQAAMWQAMLLSAGLPPSRQIMIHGFLTIDGQKISKSLGNVISPEEVAARYGTDATRYFLLRHVHPFEDSDVSWEKFDEWYTANLVNGLGNLVARVMKLAETYLDPINTNLSEELRSKMTDLKPLEEFKFNEALDNIWIRVKSCDEMLTARKPFEVIKTDPMAAKKTIHACVLNLYVIADLLQSFMPATSKAILEAIRENKKPENLFPRLEDSRI